MLESGQSDFVRLCGAIMQAHEDAVLRTLEIRSALDALACIEPSSILVGRTGTTELL